MKKISSFFYQSNVLIQRCFKILFNNKIRLLLDIFVPLVTIVVVCVVACGDMYSVKPQKKHNINDGYPVLNWETVIQEKQNEDSDEEDNELIEPEAATVSKWDGESIEMPSSPTKIDGENYFLITNANQLAFLSKAARNGYEEYLTYNYILQCDVNLKSHKFTPIGTKSNPFTGTFDGNGHIISNLKIDTDDVAGLFGYVSSNASAKKNVSVEQAMYGTELDMVFYHNGIIKNFQIKDASVKTTDKNAGIAVGYIKERARVTGVSIKDGSVYAEKGNVGGVVGFADSDEAEIYVCYSTAKVTSKGENVGGIVGKLGDARLSAAYAVCEVVCKGKKDIKNVGAVVGQSNDAQDHIKNVFYDNEVNDKYEAVRDKDYDDIAFGKETESLKTAASFLVPYKDIMTDYEMRHLSEEDEDRYNEKDYDVEEDDDIDDVYGFKKDGQLMAFAATQTGLFMLVCVAIFVGICNSIQEICKERSILKREYMTKLNLGSYVISKLCVQAVICAIQMLLVILIFALFVKGKELPSSGALFGNIWIEYFISMFLLAFAADAMSLLISSIVKSSEIASLFIPIILIVQIVLSGVLFETSGAFAIAAKLMISNWGINALAATTYLNDSQAIFMIENPQLQLSLGSSLSVVKPEYASTASNLLMIWGVLLAFIVVSSILCGILLRRVKYDKR